MKSIQCLVCTLVIILSNTMLSHADYDKQMVEVALGQFLAISDTAKVIATTECGEYISFDYQKYNVRDEAKKHLKENDYKGFLMMLESDDYKMSKNKILQTIQNGVAKKKSEGLGPEKICKDLINNVERAYNNYLGQWNEKKVLYGK